MPKTYSPKTFLRQVRGPLVNRCLRKRGCDLDLNQEIIKPAVVDELFAKLMAVPTPQLQTMESDFAAITELADGPGTAAILQEAHRQGLDLKPMFDLAHNDYERACWAFLEHPAIFDLAACFAAMDRFGSRRWNRRYVGEGLVPATSPDDVKMLAELMRRSYAREGRGRHCHIDYYLRHNPDRHCFFAYPEDHAGSELGYSEEGDLERHTRKTAFEVIYCYRPEEGLLEVMAPGGREKVEDLAACFASAILGLSELPPKFVPNAFDLDCLKYPDLSFPTDPADGIESVTVCHVSLTLPRRARWRRQVTLTAEAGAVSNEAIHITIARTIATHDVALEDVIVAKAKFAIVFAAPFGEKPKRLTFEMALPDQCSLKDTPHDQVARKYLRKWGFAVDHAGQGLVARTGRAAGGAVYLRRSGRLAS